MHISAAWRRLWSFVFAMVPVAILTFLTLSDFFAGWDGHAVSVRAPQKPEPTSYTVLIVQQGDDPIERIWSADLVEGLGLPVDPLAIPPSTIPEGRPATVKQPLTLHYRIQRPDKSWEIVPTTTPSALGLALLVLMLGIALRNMVVAGSPVGIEPRTPLPRAQTTPGSVAPPPRGGARGHKGPPPPRPRRGRGRR